MSPDAAASIVDELWGEAPAVFIAPPAEVDDTDDEGELIPLWMVRREIELELREREIERRDTSRMEAEIEGLARSRMQAALGELLHGRRARDLGAQRDHWMLLAWMAVEEMHGGAFRVWDGERRDWRTRLRRRCARGCKWCRKAAP